MIPIFLVVTTPEINFVDVVVTSPFAGRNSAGFTFHILVGVVNDSIRIATINDHNASGIGSIMVRANSSIGRSLARNQSVAHNGNAVGFNILFASAHAKRCCEYDSCYDSEQKNSLFRHCFKFLCVFTLLLFSTKSLNAYTLQRYSAVLYIIIQHCKDRHFFLHVTIF